MYRKFCANRERNWLLALTLNAFAKLAANAQLSDLEQSMVNAFRKNGFSDEELKLHGRVYGQIPGQIRTKMFPDRFAKMTPRSAYTMRDLQQDAPNIVSSVLGMRNVTNVDVQAIHAGTASRKDFPMVTRDVLKEHGGAMFVALAPDTTPETPPHTYTIKATSFRCNDETGADFLGSDEPYWIFGAVGGGFRSPRGARSLGMSILGKAEISRQTKDVSGGRTVQPKLCQKGR